MSTSTIKLVLIGASGVGKTSLRSQYISGHMSTNYRATIGADFITKILPHPTSPDQSVALQIWDTAGQERFSSLSSAFFRGADAALLMFDVNDPQTLYSLTKWWQEFKDRAPLADGDVDDYCCVVVGNKMDLAEDRGEQRVSETEALRFLGQLIPPFPSSPAQPPSPVTETYENEDEAADELSASQLTERPPTVPIPTSSAPPHDPHSLFPSNTPPNRHPSRSVGNGTIGTTRTALTIYHTPSSSLFEQFHSARGSPEPSFHVYSRSQSPPHSPSKLSRGRMPSLSSSSSGGTTITPSMFARSRGSEVDGVNHSVSGSESTTLTSTVVPPRDRGPRLFFTSARTGQGVQGVFEYIAKRVVRKWEDDESAVRVQRVSAVESVRLVAGNTRGRGRGRGKSRGTCCSS